MFLYKYIKGLAAALLLSSCAYSGKTAIKSRTIQQEKTSRHVCTDVPARKNQSLPPRERRRTLASILSDLDPIGFAFRGGQAHLILSDRDSEGYLRIGLDEVIYEIHAANNPPSKGFEDPLIKKCCISHRGLRYCEKNPEFAGRLCKNIFSKTKDKVIHAYTAEFRKLVTLKPKYTVVKKSKSAASIRFKDWRNKHKYEWFAATGRGKDDDSYLIVVSRVICRKVLTTDRCGNHLRLDGNSYRMKHEIETLIEYAKKMKKMSSGK